jgi:cytochrome c-type biogenesis protein CcmF
VVLGGYDAPSQLATLQVFVNPLVSWLWIGGLTLVLGTCIIMLPNPAERHALALARAQTGMGKEIAAE